MEGEIMQTVNAVGTGLASAYALYNREGGLRDTVKNNFSNIGEFYKKISPAIEHAAFAYAVTSAGYYAQGNESINEFMLNQYENSPTDKYGFIAASCATSMDFLWEVAQSIERREIKPAQFIGTLIGSAAGIAQNNLESLL